MRITENSQSITSYNLKASTNRSDKATSILDSLGETNKLFSSASLSTGETEVSSLDELVSQMNNDPRVQMMKMKINTSGEDRVADMEQMKTLMDTVANADLESMSLDEKKALMEEIQTTMDNLSGATERTSGSDTLSEEELTEMLQAVQTKALEGPKGPGGPGGPGGPPPAGPPPSQKSSDGSEAVVGSTEESSTLTTLEALLKALSEEEEEEKASLAASSDKNVAISNAIEQYNRNTNWAVTDLRSVQEA